MVTSELCHVLVEALPTPLECCCPLLYRMLISSLYCLEPCSSCGEDMETSDAEVEEEILPPSKVMMPPSPLDVCSFPNPANECVQYFCISAAASCSLS